MLFAYRIDNSDHAIVDASPGSRTIEKDRLSIGDVYLELRRLWLELEVAIWVG
jgi:hypothetical protein